MKGYYLTSSICFFSCPDALSEAPLHIEQSAGSPFATCPSAYALAPFDSKAESTVFFSCPSA
ncbi:MAG: hypothetical protein WKF36_10630 [Candidatus Nitrosocosmicus sp.]